MDMCPLGGFMLYGSHSLLVDDELFIMIMASNFVSKGHLRTAALM